MTYKEITKTIAPWIFIEYDIEDDMQLASLHSDNRKLALSCDQRLVKWWRVRIKYWDLFPYCDYYGLYKKI